MREVLGWAPVSGLDEAVTSMVTKVRNGEKNRQETAGRTREDELISTYSVWAACWTSDNCPVGNWILGTEGIYSIVTEIK